MFLLGGYWVIEGRFSMGSFVAFTAYQARLLSPVQGLLGLYLGIQAARASLERVFALLDERPEVTESPQAQALETAAGHLQLRSVSLGHGRGSEVLSNISLEAVSGRVTAIVGPSGVGKSTIADLVLRRLDPDEGQISLDGIDLRIEMDSLVVLTTCQHPLDPDPVYAPKPVNITVSPADPSDPVTDLCLNSRPENRRAWQNTQDYYALRAPVVGDR